MFQQVSETLLEEKLGRDLGDNPGDGLKSLVGFNHWYTSERESKGVCVWVNIMFIF